MVAAAGSGVYRAAMLNREAEAVNILDNTLLLISQYVHLLATTLLVGGTLFYEMVVPIAIADLKSEQQLAIFARARWVFRRIVWVNVVLLVVTGVYSTRAHWKDYTDLERVPTYLPADGKASGNWNDEDDQPDAAGAVAHAVEAPAGSATQATSQPAMQNPSGADDAEDVGSRQSTFNGRRLNGVEASMAMRSGWWWAAHASCGSLALLIAVFLNTGPTPPDHPVQWMRLNLVILMIVIFLAAATNHVRTSSYNASQDSRLRYEP